MVLLLGWPRPSSGWAARYMRHVVDAPMGLPAPRRIDLGWFLARQHQEARLDVGVVLARRRALRAVLESIQ